MNDHSFHGSLDGAKLIARNEEKDVVRRVQFKFGCDFCIEDAEWLGVERMRTDLINGVLDTFDVPIDAFHAKASFSGTKGNAEVQVQGVSAAAKMSGGEEPEPRITITLEAFPTDVLLTWLASSLKEYVDVELLALQGDLLEKARNAVASLQESGMTASVTVGGKKRQLEVPGTAKPEKKAAAKKGKGRRR